MRTCVLVALALVWGLSAPAFSDWIITDPACIARECPIIVTGEIVKIDVAVAKSTEPRPETGEQGVMDVAHIKVSTVHKNMLGDVKTQPGGEILAHMDSLHKDGGPKLTPTRQ